MSLDEYENSSLNKVSDYLKNPFIIILDVSNVVKLSWRVADAHKYKFSKKSEDGKELQEWHDNVDEIDFGKCGNDYVHHIKYVNKLANVYNFDTAFFLQPIYTW